MYTHVKNIYYIVYVVCVILNVTHHREYTLLLTAARTAAGRVCREMEMTSSTTTTMRSVLCASVLCVVSSIFRTRNASDRATTFTGTLLLCLCLSIRFRFQATTALML